MAAKTQLEELQPFVITVEELIRFGTVVEWDVMQAGISREEWADEAKVHVSQLSQIKSKPDLLKVAHFFKRLGALEERKRLATGR